MKNKKEFSMKRKIMILLASLLVIGSLAACSTTPVNVSTLPQTRTLSSNGNGMVYIAPDIAYINIGVHTEAPEVSTALSDNSAQALKVSQALTALGVEAKDIQTTSFNVYPMSTYAPDGTISSKYYAVDNTVYVTVRDLSKLGNLLDAVVKSGANTINSISFDIQNKDAAMAQARDMAIAKAKSEAESIAAAAGVKLGDLQTVSVSSNGYPTPVYDGKGGASAIAASVPVSAGQLVVSADAYMTY
jgi:uncharacterized protein